MNNNFDALTKLCIGVALLGWAALASARNTEIELRRETKQLLMEIKSGCAKSEAKP